MQRARMAARLAVGLAVALTAGCGGEKPAACDSFEKVQAAFEDIQSLDLQKDTAADGRPLYDKLANDVVDLQQDAEGAIAEKTSAFNDAVKNAVAAIRQSAPETSMAEIVSRNPATLAKVKTAYDALAAAVTQLDC